YHGPPGRAPPGQEEEELAVGSLEWLLREAEVSWRAPKSEPAPQVTLPREQQEELDRLIQETLVERTSERVNLRQRVDVIHKGGQPDPEESCNAVSRACWAGPLIQMAKGVHSVTIPLGVCCSDAMEMAGNDCRSSEARIRRKKRSGLDEKPAQTVTQALLEYFGLSKDEEPWTGRVSAMPSLERVKLQEMQPGSQLPRRPRGLESERR
ncbi:unnamed protein product, partial [Polarella glacialis]